MPHSKKHFRKIQEELPFHLMTPKTPQTTSSSYELAFLDLDFILRKDLRPVRLLLELLKPELIQKEHGIKATITVFGSARSKPRSLVLKELKAIKEQITLHPHSKKLVEQLKYWTKHLEYSAYYRKAQEFGKLASKLELGKDKTPVVVVTGGGPGIMEAANKGATRAGKKSIGMSVLLPGEGAPNAYVSPELSFQFHYFSLRKMHLLMRSQALVAFPGGYGTFDELFEVLTLIATKKIRPMPVILYGSQFWHNVINFKKLLEDDMISPKDLDLFHTVDDPVEACTIIENFYNPSLQKKGKKS